MCVCLCVDIESLSAQGLSLYLFISSPYNLTRHILSPLYRLENWVPRNQVTWLVCGPLQPFSDESVSNLLQRGQQQTKTTKPFKSNIEKQWPYWSYYRGVWVSCSCITPELTPGWWWLMEDYMHHSHPLHTVCSQLCQEDSCHKSIPVQIAGEGLSEFG